MIRLNAVKNSYNVNKNYAIELYTKIKNAVTFKDVPREEFGCYNAKGNKIVMGRCPIPVIKYINRFGTPVIWSLLAANCAGIYLAHMQSVNAMEAVPYNIQKAKEKAQEHEAIVFDEKIPLPESLAKATKNPESWGGRFYNSLKDNKEALTADLGISSEEYNKNAIMALKLSKEESQFGNSSKFKTLNTLHRNELTLDAYAYTRAANEVISRLKSDFLSLKFADMYDDVQVKNTDKMVSLGMTQFKISNASEEEKALFKKYGITYENNRSNIVDPEESAIATMIHIATLRKKYNTYLEAIEPLKPDINDPKVQESVKNAQKLIFNNRIRPSIIYALQEQDYGNDELYYLKEKDAEDLKIYARTIVLSPDAHLIALWNGRGVIPNPNKSPAALHQTYANLLYLAAQKGYIANMDKTSEVIY